MTFLLGLGLAFGALWSIIAIGLGCGANEWRKQGKEAYVPLLRYMWNDLGNGVGGFLALFLGLAPFTWPVAAGTVVSRIGIRLRSWASSKGDTNMLWLTKWVAKKSLAISFWFTLGLTYTQWSGMVEEWYNAPPSLEAQKLVASLNELEGWRLMAGSDNPKLVRGVTTIAPATWRADVFVSSSDCSGQFSFSDRRAINKAANICLRKLTAKAMEQPTRVKETKQ